jgi:hypothetical protein
MKTRYGYIVGRDAIHHANFGAEREGHDEMKVRDTSSKAQILGCPPQSDDQSGIDRHCSTK